MLQEPRYVSPRQGRQTASLARLSEIENRIRSRRQALEQTRQVTSGPTLTSHLTVSPPAAMDTTQQVSTGAQSQRRNRFLKNKSAGCVESTNTSTAVASQSADGLSPRVRTRDAAALPADLETKPGRRTSNVSVESDEEYMQKLLGDFEDSSDHSVSGPERASSMKREGKMLHRPGQKVQSIAPPAAHPPLPSDVPPSRSSASPSRCSSPFRFSSKTQAHFSPSVVPTSPSPPPVSILPSERIDTHNSEHSALSSLGGAKVLSLDQRFQVGSASEEPHSQKNSVSSEDFKINVMTLDELIPAAVGFTSETSGKENQRKLKDPVSGSWNKHQQVPQEEEQVEEALNYQSDFDSYVSGDEGAAASLVTQDERTKDIDSSTLSDPSDLSSSQIAERSRKSMLVGKSSQPGSSASPSSQSSYRSPRRYSSAAKAVRDAAVQTQPRPMNDSWSTGMATLDPTVARLYLNPPPVVTHAVSAARLEAIYMSDPAAFALNEMLKQQFSMTKHFIDSSDHLHSCLRRSLEPPNYRYTRLKDTLQKSKHRAPRRRAEKASK
uniref:Calcium homeostasis endoplasmic reticulum protein n=2 Tax=Nothobranchius pienaari TaxID=704102 RepID=A0A1A8LBD1_9TELE